MKTILLTIILSACGSLTEAEYRRCDFTAERLCPNPYLCVNDDTEDGPHCYGQCGWETPEQDRCPKWEVCTRLDQGGLPTNHFACLPRKDGGL